MERYGELRKLKVLDVHVTVKRQDTSDFHLDIGKFQAS